MDTDTPNVTMCAFHPELRAVFVCASCYQPICNLCSFSRTDGSRFCSTCAQKAPTISSSGPKIVGQTDAPVQAIRSRRCVQHPNVAAVRTCKSCLQPMCAVCDFLLPGNLHLCPACIVGPSRAMSKGRKGLIIAAYVIALYNTIGLAAVVAGVFAGMADSGGFEIMFSLFLFAPTLIGAALGISCFDQRLRNPPAIWVAAIWNCLLLGIHLILVVIGTFMK